MPCIVFECLARQVSGALLASEQIEQASSKECTGQGNLDDATDHGYNKIHAYRRRGQGENLSQTAMPVRKPKESRSQQIHRLAVRVKQATLVRYAAAKKKTVVLTFGTAYSTSKTRDPIHSKVRTPLSLGDRGLPLLTSITRVIAIRRKVTMVAHASTFLDTA